MQVPAVQATQKSPMPMLRFGYQGREVIAGVFRKANEEQLPLVSVYREIESFNERHGTKLKVISPAMADFLLCRTILPIQAEHEVFGVGANGFHFPVDMIAGHEASAETRLGTVISFNWRSNNIPRVILPTSGYNGESGIALVVVGLSSEDFKKDGRDIYMDVSNERLVPVRNFVRKRGTGLCNVDEKTTLPVGEQIIDRDISGQTLEQMDEYEKRRGEPWLGARYFWMVGNGPYVGPLIRDTFGHFRTGINLCTGIDRQTFSALVEISSEDLGRFSMKAEDIHRLPSFDIGTPFSLFRNSPAR